jgi:hypothetical protein
MPGSTAIPALAGRGREPAAGLPGGTVAGFRWSGSTECATARATRPRSASGPTKCRTSRWTATLRPARRGRAADDLVHARGGGGHPRRHRPGPDPRPGQARAHRRRVWVLLAGLRRPSESSEDSDDGHAHSAANEVQTRALRWAKSRKVAGGRPVTFSTSSFGVEPQPAMMVPVSQRSTTA